LELGLKESFYSKKDLHLHIPEGATPKEDPSAGIAIVFAFVFVLTQNPIKLELAMMDEVSLQWRVLSVGGLEEK